MKAPEFDYSKLKGLIVEKYGSQSEFAMVLGISENQLSKNMTNRKRFSINTIDRSIELLEIPYENVSQYFFTPKVR